MEMLRAKAQKFTHSEIRAEVLRQRIQELEQTEFKSGNDPQTVAILQKLANLQDELSRVDVHANLNSEYRKLVNRYIVMMEHFRENDDVPSDAEEVIEGLRRWLDKAENQRRREFLQELSVCRQVWPEASWSNRARVIRWVGRHSLRQIGFEYPRYRLGRMMLGWMLKGSKRWH